MEPIKIIECPRDAMQGIKTFIPTEVKVNYLQALLRVGFDTLDFGSFVSPKAIPQMQDIAQGANKEVVAYLSMGFGNPYGDPWNVEIVGEWTERLAQMGVTILSLSDTIGSSTPEVIEYLFGNLIPKYPNVEFGAHLHTTPDKWFEKVDAAYRAGCRRFDGAIQGFGGCPMAKDDLTGNMPTEKMLSYFTSIKADTGLSPMSFESAYNVASRVFGEFH